MYVFLLIKAMSEANCVVCASGTNESWPNSPLLISFLLDYATSENKVPLQAGFGMLASTINHKGAVLNEISTFLESKKESR